MFECRIRREKFPKEGEVVIGKITAISQDSVTMELLEYGDIPGMILIGELSKKRFKTVAQITKVGNVEICQVLKVEEDKEFIDLSLKRVSEDEKQECKESFSKAKLAYQIISKACKLSGASIKDTYETWGYQKELGYGSLFAYFAAVRNSLEMLDQEPNGEYFRKIIEEQFKASTYKVRADVDVVCIKAGVLGIKAAFEKVQDYDSTFEIALQKSPTYSIMKIGDDKDDAFNKINTACEILKEAVESAEGTFSISSPARLYGEKSRHNVLTNVQEDVSDDEE